MKKLHAFGTGLMLCFVTTANAALSYIDANGNPVAAPAVLDGSKDAIYFGEAVDEFGNGQYTVTNNTVDYGLFAFGISNVDTLAWVSSIGRTFNCGLGWCYEAITLNAVNWNSTVIDFSGNTGMDIFGDISNVMDSGENTINFYLSNDGMISFTIQDLS